MTSCAIFANFMMEGLSIKPTLSNIEGTLEEWDAVGEEERKVRIISSKLKFYNNLYYFFGILWGAK